MRRHFGKVRLTKTFYRRLFGPEAEQLVEFLPLFEIVPDWGNHAVIDLPREDFHRRMRQGVDLVHDLKGRESNVPFHPSPEAYRRELEFFFQLFADLTGPSPDFGELHDRYWKRVYAIYDLLPEHADPRPRNATIQLIRFFDPKSNQSPVIPGL